MLPSAPRDGGGSWAQPRGHGKGTRTWVAVWLFPGCEHPAGGESRSLQGARGFGGLFQEGFGQPGLLGRFFGLLATAGRCVGCFALLVSPWPSRPGGHFSSPGTSPLWRPVHDGAALRHQTSLPPLVAPTAGPCFGDALLERSLVESVLRLVPSVLPLGIQQLLGEAVWCLGGAVRPSGFVGLAFRFSTRSQQRRGRLPSETPTVIGISTQRVGGRAPRRTSARLVWGSRSSTSGAGLRRQDAKGWGALLEVGTTSTVLIFPAAGRTPRTCISSPTWPSP